MESNLNLRSDRGQDKGTWELGYFCRVAARPEVRIVAAAIATVFVESKKVSGAAGQDAGLWSRRYAGTCRPDYHGIAGAWYHLS